MARPIEVTFTDHELDGLPATALILETVPRLDPRKEFA